MTPQPSSQPPSHPPTQLRIMQAIDISEVVRIEKQAYPYPWSTRSFVDCLQPQYMSWVLCEAELIIGYLIVQPVVDELHLLNICVTPDYQRQGHGHQLMRHCLDFAISLELFSILLEVRKSNLGAQKLYAKWQFQCIGQRKDYYPLHTRHADTGREDAQVYRLRINPKAFNEKT